MTSGGRPDTAEGTLITVWADATPGSKRRRTRRRQPAANKWRNRPGPSSSQSCSTRARLFEGEDEGRTGSVRCHMLKPPEAGTPLHSFIFNFIISLSRFDIRCGQLRLVRFKIQAHQGIGPILRRSLAGLRPSLQSRGDFHAGPGGGPSARSILDLPSPGLPAAGDAPSIPPG